MAIFNLVLVGVFLTIFGGGEYMAKNGNVLYQPTLSGYDGSPPLITGKVINNCNNPQYGGVVAIDVSNPSNPQKIGLLQAPHDVSFGGVSTTTLSGGVSVVAAGNTPCYGWAVLPDISTDLNPKINGKIQGKGGATWWDVTNPLSPHLLPDITVTRDYKSLVRRNMLLAAGMNMTDVSTGTTFLGSASPFVEYVFQSSDDAVIRTTFFTQNQRDYMLLNTISGDLGLAIFDVTVPRSPIQITTFSPQMNYLLRVKDVCRDIPGYGSSPAYSNRYFEDLDPTNNPRDFEAMQILATAYWTSINERSFPAEDQIYLQGVANPVTFHSTYIPSKKALLVSVSAEFMYLDLINIRRPRIVFNLADRTRFPSLKTPSGFDLIQYYTRNGREVTYGYHNSNVKMIGNKLIMAIDHDNYYVTAERQYIINTGASLWDITNENEPKLLSFIEHPNDECHSVQLTSFGGLELLFTTGLVEGVKTFNLTDLENPVLIAGAAGTFEVAPGIPPISYPNPFSGFDVSDFAGYEEPFRTVSMITNLPGSPDVIPYQFVPLSFEALVDDGYVYMQSRSGVTYIFMQT